MHIHGNLNNVLAEGLNTAVNTRAENAGRATQTRRRLRKSAQTIDATALEASTLDSTEPGASFLASEWLSVRHSVALADDEYKPSPRRRKIVAA
jgi:hypothetical protein